MRYVLLDMYDYYPSGLYDLIGVFTTLEEAQAIPVKYDHQQILDTVEMRIWNRGRRDEHWTEEAVVYTSTPTHHLKART